MTNYSSDIPARVLNILLKMNDKNGPHTNLRPIVAIARTRLKLIHNLLFTNNKMYLRIFVCFISIFRLSKLCSQLVIRYGHNQLYGKFLWEVGNTRKGQFDELVSTALWIFLFFRKSQFEELVSTALWIFLFFRKSQFEELVSIPLQIFLFFSLFIRDSMHTFQPPSSSEREVCNIPSISQRWHHGCQNFGF